MTWSVLSLLCRRDRLLAFVFVFGLLLTTDTEAQGPGQPVQQPPVEVHKRFEYKYSFKPPYLAQKDGTVPFFEYSGSKYSLVCLPCKSPIYPAVPSAWH